MGDAAAAEGACWAWLNGSAVLHGCAHHATLAAAHELCGLLAELGRPAEAEAVAAKALQLRAHAQERGHGGGGYAPGALGGAQTSVGALAAAYAAARAALGAPERSSSVDAQRNDARAMTPASPAFGAGASTESLDEGARSSEREMSRHKAAS
ncbi:hypothetical protein KFE25_014212 [Diacronema lutheri]|uniref:Uncharacterized protein n=1 Tax=Diacronema lutheri TaxID=2081491 RepID=A0A8J5XFS6_DIALT|nr:hypothetical protein KFE25_014212 [Diacronema lutheri]